MVLGVKIKVENHCPMRLVRLLITRLKANEELGIIIIRPSRKASMSSRERIERAVQCSQSIYSYTLSVFSILYVNHSVSFARGRPSFMADIMLVNDNVSWFRQRLSL